MTLLTEGELKDRLRQQLDGTEPTRAAVAAEAGVSPSRLSAMLRGGSIGDPTAERLGFRRVVMFEPI